MSGQRGRAEWKRPLTTRRVRQPHFPFGSRQFDHIRGLHCGTKFTKAIVSEHYYFQRLDSKAFHLVKTCIEGQRRRKKLMSQPTGDLPEWCTKAFKPWECVGLVYLGPLKGLPFAWKKARSTKDLS